MRSRTKPSIPFQHIMPSNRTFSPGHGETLLMPTPALTRELTLPAAAALVVGQVIAVGIFLTPGTIIRTLASPLWVLLIWAVMGGMAICGALCYGALAARYPEAGGGYVYLREAYGPRVAFLYGWKCLLIMDPGITAALATGFAALRRATSCRSACRRRALVAIAAIVVVRRRAHRGRQPRQPVADRR